MELSTIALWTIRPRLMAVPGVANVAIWGQRDRQLQVLIDPDRLAAAGVTLAEVQAAAGSGVAVETGGFIDTPNQRLAVSHRSARHLGGRSGAGGRPRARRAPPIRIGDVADVVEASPPPIGDAIINNVPGLLLIVEKQLGANTLAVTRGVDAALAALAPGARGRRRRRHDLPARRPSSRPRSRI